MAKSKPKAPKDKPKPAAERPGKPKPGVKKKFPVAHQKVLECLQTDKTMTYNDIKDKTGYYANLTKVLLTGPDSLCGLGYAKVTQVQSGNRKVKAFTATTKGKAVLGKLTKAA